MRSPLESLRQPPRALACSNCHKPGHRRITSFSNPNGNAGRPYYYCSPCRKFISFDDERGKRDENPLCECGKPSRSQLNGKNSRPPGGVHFVCSEGQCDFFDRDCWNGEQVVIAADLIDQLAHLSII